MDLFESTHHFVEPACSFATRGTLTATFVFVELTESGDHFDDVGGFIHDYDCCCSEARLCVFQ